MIYSGTVNTAHYDGKLEVILDDGDTFVDGVIPLTIGGRRGDGVFYRPAAGDRCVLFYDSNKKPYAMFAQMEVLQDDGTLSYTPTFPRSSNDVPGMQTRDFWVGNSNKYICIRSRGNIDLKAGPGCGITLNPSGQRLSFSSSAYEFYSTGMNVLHAINTITGLQHVEEYQDPGTGVPAGNFYEYMIKDSLGIEKVSVKVDKTNLIQLKLGQVDVTFLPWEINVAVNTPPTTQIKIDQAGNVDIKTVGITTLDGSIIKLGDKASSHAIKGEDLISYLATHTHTVAAAPGATSPPVNPPAFTLLARKTLVE